MLRDPRVVLGAVAVCATGIAMQSSGVLVDPIWSWGPLTVSVASLMIYVPALVLLHLHTHVLERSIRFFMNSAALRLILTVVVLLGVLGAVDLVAASFGHPIGLVDIVVDFVTQGGVQVK